MEEDCITAKGLMLNKRRRLSKPDVCKPSRPPGWFSQNDSSLLENSEKPKRKKCSDKGNISVETPRENIVGILTNERIAELKQMMEEKRAAFMRLKKEIDLVKSGQADHILPALLKEIEEEKKQEAMARKKATMSVYDQLATTEQGGAVSTNK